mmetsp:Transcript_60830/g.181250  ORF Transcript_60830/g.181250 Transcript_60830/m.181250 type:complete len:256 (+) Transcript_60830:1107-1874(+)
MGAADRLLRQRELPTSLPLDAHEVLEETLQVTDALSRSSALQAAVLVKLGTDRGAHLQLVIKKVHRCHAPCSVLRRVCPSAETDAVGRLLGPLHVRFATTLRREQRSVEKPPHGRRCFRGLRPVARRREHVVLDDAPQLHASITEVILAYVQEPEVRSLRYHETGGILCILLPTPLLELILYGGEGKQLGTVFVSPMLHHDIAEIVVHSPEDSHTTSAASQSHGVLEGGWNSDVWVDGLQAAVRDESHPADALGV